MLVKTLLKNKKIFYLASSTKLNVLSTRKFSESPKILITGIFNLKIKLTKQNLKK